MNYVYSTMTCGTNFAFYDTTDKNSMPRLLKQIEIKGGHKVATKALFTPQGVVTPVSDEDLSMLETHPLFLDQKRKGFISVQKKEVRNEKVIKDMTDEDGSAPITPRDFVKSDSFDEMAIYKKRKML